MEKGREDFIERWVKYMAKNPNWKEVHTAFINAQFEKANRFIQETLKEKYGEDKIADIYGIKNRKGYPNLFKKSLRKL